MIFWSRDFFFFFTAMALGDFSSRGGGGNGSFLYHKIFHLGLDRFSVSPVYFALEKGAGNTPSI